MLPPAGRAQLDLVSLAVLPGSYIDEELRQTHSDLLYGVRTASGEPALVCVVLHHGDDGWSARSEFASMLDAGQDAIEAMRELTPHCRRSIGAFARRARATHAPRLGAPHADRLVDVELGRALLSQLYAYLLQVLKDVDGDKWTVNFLKLQGQKDERTLSPLQNN